MKGRFTRFRSDWPKVLGKCFHLNSVAALVKETSGSLSRGAHTVEHFESPESLIALLTSFQTNEALSASIPIDGSASGQIVTESALASNPKAKARSKKYFKLADAPGLGIIDVDDATLTLEQLRDEILTACPGLSDATLIGWLSASSLIYSGDTCLSPAKGLRVYIPIASVADWPRALKALNARLALRGHFRCIVSSAGAILERPLLDAAMGDSGARLDFAPTGAICEPPLEQRRPAPQVLHAGNAFVDTRKAVPDLTPDEANRHCTVAQQARDAVRGEAEAKRAAWRVEHEQKAITNAAANAQPVDVEQIRTEVRGGAANLNTAMSGNSAL